MKLANESQAGISAPFPPGLDGLVARVAALSLSPQFSEERNRALSLALRFYVEAGETALLAPFAQEVDLAALTMYADYYPQNGQLTLIEQVRDVVTEHIPEEERAWMDPLKHSYMDLVEILPGGHAMERWVGRSLGNGRLYQVQGGAFSQGLQSGQVLLTRLVQQPGDPETDRVVLAGSALVLSLAEGQALYEATSELRREREINAGSFELGDWHEFAKRFGYEMLWGYAQMRLDRLRNVVTGIRYRAPDGQPYLYAVALYEHREFTLFRDRLAEMDGLEAGSAALAEAGVPGASARWVRHGSNESGAAAIVARLTLTPTQLWVETDSRERLDALKHQLASVFGFSIHFRGESTAPPPHRLRVEELDAEQPVRVVVPAGQDASFLKTFLETVYLEWTDRAAPVLGGQTPRHAAATPAGLGQVARLIDEMERHDLGWSRIGKPAFDYNVLRGHVGIEEVRRGDVPAERTR
ncbi:MAG: hypothetical protein IT389_03575 [Nitrospira sp.]|nr:hypothetical protein [Nitrospira sp.]